MLRSLFDGCLYFGLVLLTLGAAQCAHIPIDPAQAATLANDFTIVFQDAGTVSQKGYLFIQKRAGTLPDDALVVLVPKLNCKRAACARFQFFRKDGTPGFSGSIPAGSETLSFKLSDLVGHTTAVDATDEGEYSALSQLYYVGNDGQEYSTLMNGFIRLNILSKTYEPLSCGDPNTAFRLGVNATCEADFSTAGRSAVCGAGCR